MTNWRCQSLRSPPTISGQCLCLSALYTFDQNVTFHRQRYSVAEWYGAALATARSRIANSNPARGCCVPTPSRLLSVPSLRCRLMSTSKSWGVNGHTTRCTSPEFRGLAASAGVRLRAKKTEISAALWALARERTLPLLYSPAWITSSHHSSNAWLGGTTGSASDQRSEGCGFEAY